MSARKIRALLLSSVALTIFSTHLRAQTVPVPLRTADFVGSIGVNTHLGWWDTSWGIGGGKWVGNEAQVEAELAYIGVQNLRDSVPSGAQIAEWDDLALKGYAFDLVQTVSNGQVQIPADLQNIQAFLKVLAALAAKKTTYEGANEYNANRYALNGQQSYGNLAWGALDDRASRSALQGALLFVAASTASVPSAPTLPGGSIDAANQHVYGGTGEQLRQNLIPSIQASHVTAPGKPVWITELGISSAALSASTWGNAGDEATQAVIDLNALLDAYANGAARAYLYVLQDAKKALDLESSFGLFNPDGTPKVVATSLHNLTGILSDPGAAASTFVPAPIALAFSGLPSTASWLLLEKSQGTYEVLVWNSGAAVSGPSGDLTPPVSPVVVKLGTPYGVVKTYDPVKSSAPAVSLTQQSSVAISLSRDPQVVEFSGPVSPSGDTLDVKVSEDAWQGDAQFTVSLDGAQVGSIMTATALHGAGKTDDVVLMGHWGPGPHVVSVRFLNDAWGGIASEDRNLYVESVTYDGKASSTPATELQWSGTTNFSTP